ncbi:unnamed protein product [Haemonchus placei]|uniref:Golgin-84 n=1 Tax=Haemonchus placei TaxID=6290 RepID=A0A158QKV1_HAEPC|nr:unnamed protein product [Haemonchus placei]
MSWITKVSDLAGKAEDLLNRLDQTTNEAIQSQKARAHSSRPPFSSSYTHLKDDEGEGEVHTEEIGRSGPSLPSRTHSEFAGGAAAGRKRIHEHPVPSTTVVSERERRDEELIAMLTDNVGNDVDETRSRRSKQPLDLPQMRSQLWAKESQVAAMRSKISVSYPLQSFMRRIVSHCGRLTTTCNPFQELERKLTKRSDEFYELMAEKDMIAQRLAQQTNADCVEELKLAREKAQEQRDALLEECTLLKKKCMAHEEEVRAMGEQLRLAKFNLSENKKEFDQYKEKAQKILHAKEKLVDSLKAEQNTGDVADRPGHPLQAELEEMRVERDLARADLESAQLMVYNLRSEIEEMENQLREEQMKQSEQRRQYLEEKQSWHATVALLNEKVDCARLAQACILLLFVTYRLFLLLHLPFSCVKRKVRGTESRVCYRIESEFAKREMKRQNDDFARKLETQEAQLRKNVEDQRARRREEDTRSADGLSLGERLLQKQIELEEAHRRNQMLSIRLEKLQKYARETVIPIDPPSASLPVHHPAAKQAVTVVDSIVFRMISVLRNYPTARIFVTVYFVLVHLWVFFIVLTYTPEMHDATGTPPGGNGGGSLSKP